MAIQEKITLDVKPFLESLQKLNEEAAKFSAQLQKSLSTNKPVAIDFTTDPADFQKIQAQINKLSDNSINLDVNTGKDAGFFSNFKNQVNEARGEGNLFTAMTGNLASGIGAIINPMTLAVGAAAALSGGLAKVYNVGSKFETNLQAVSAVTGVAGAALKDIGDRAQNLAAQFGGSASDQLGVFQVTLSKIGPQLAENSGALTKFAENVNILSKTDSALGAAGAVDALTGAMLQFGVDVNDSNLVAQESSRFINVLAKSAAVGSASVSDVAAAVANVGGIANNANVSFEELNAGLQVLAAKSITGSSAGTALAAVLGALQKAPGPAAEKLKQLGTSSEKLGELLTTKGLKGAMDELGKAMDKLGSDAQKNAFLTDLFGQTGQSAANALLQGKDVLADWTQQMTGSQAATEQAAINMNTLSEAFSRFSARLENIGIGIYQAVAPSILQLFSLFGQVIDTISPVLDTIKNNIVNAFSGIGALIQPALAAIGAIIGTSFLATVTVLSTAFTLISSVISGIVDNLTNLFLPIFNQIASAFGLTGENALTLTDVFKVFGDVVSSLAGIAATVGEAFANLLTKPIEIAVNIIVGLFNLAKNAISEVIPTTEQVNNAFNTTKQILSDYAPLLGGLIAGYAAYEVASNAAAIKEQALTVIQNTRKGITATITAAQWAYNAAITAGTGVISAAQAALQFLSSGQVLVAAKTAIVTAAQWAWNVALSANPIGLIVGAIAALVAGLVLAYTKSETFRAIIDGMWEAIKRFAGAVWDAIKIVADFLGLLPDEKKVDVKVKQEVKQEIKQEVIPDKEAKKEEKLSEEELKKLQKARFDAAKKEVDELKERNALNLRDIKFALEKKEIETGIKASKEELLKIAELERKNTEEEIKLAQKLFKTVGAGANLKINAPIGESKDAAKKIVNDLETELAKNEISIAKLTGKIAVPKDFKAELEKLVSDFESQQINIEFIARISKTKPKKDLDELINNLEGEKFFLQAELEGITDENKRKIINDTIAKIDAEIAKAKLSFDGKLNMSVGFDEAKKQVDTFIEDLDKQKQSIELAIKGKTDPKEIKELEDLLLVINKKRLDAEKNFEKLTTEIGDKAFNARLALVEDEEEKKKLIKIRALQKERDEAISAEYLTQEEKIEVIKKYGKEIEKINKSGIFSLAQYTSDTLLGAMNSLAEGSKGATDEQKKAYEEAKEKLDEVNAKHKERIDNIEKELSTLLKGNEKGTASYNKVAEKLAKLEDDKKKAVLEANKEIEEANKKLQENSIETGDLIKNNLAESFKKMRETATTQLNAVAAKMGEAFSKLKVNADGSAANFSEVTDNMLNNLAQAASITIGVIGAGFGELLAKGGANFGDFAKVAASAVLDSVQVMVNAYAAAIFGQNASALPFGLGIPAALGLIAGMNVLLAVAKASLAKVGAESGVIGINKNYNKKAGKTDTIPLWVAPNESIINAKQSLKYKGILEAINSGGNVSGAIINNLPQSELKMLQKYMSGNTLSGDIKRDVVNNVNKIFTSNSYDNSTENRFNRNSTLNKVHEQMQYYYDNKSYSSLYRSLVENKYHNLVQHFTSPEKNIYTVQENIRPKENNNELRYLADKLDNLKIVLERNEIIDITGELKGNGRDFNAMFNKELRRKSRRF